MHFPRSRASTAVALGACLAAGWAALAWRAYAAGHLPPTFGAGVLTWVAPPLAASALLVAGGLRRWAGVPERRRGRARAASALYPLAVLAGLGGIGLALFLLEMCRMIGAFP